MALAGFVRYSLEVQALYILNNISDWRGEEAKITRATLKQFAGVK